MHEIPSNIILNPDGLICGTHPFSLGTFYRPSKMCKCFLHTKNSKAKGAKISFQLYNFIKARDASFILGSLICKTCRAKLGTIECEDNEYKDSSFVPLVSTSDDSERMSKREKLDALTQIF